MAGVVVTWVLKDVRHRTALDDLPLRHDAHRGDLVDDVEVVGDEQQRHAELRCSFFSSVRICA